MIRDGFALTGGTKGGRWELSRDGAMLMDVARGWDGSGWNESMAIVEALLDAGMVVCGAVW